MGRLHDALEASGYRAAHDLERCSWCASVFCLFADDTGIFEPRDIFLDLLETRTRKDGSDLRRSRLARIVPGAEYASRPASGQTTLDEDLARFPYVNGDLFNGTALRIPSILTRRCASALI